MKKGGIRSNIILSNGFQLIKHMCLSTSKEARESKCWIDLLIKTNFLSAEDKHTKSLINDIDELVKILTSIVKTTKEKE